MVISHSDKIFEVSSAGRSSRADLDGFQLYAFIISDFATAIERMEQKEDGNRIFGKGSFAWIETCHLHYRKLKEIVKNEMERGGHELLIKVTALGEKIDPSRLNFKDNDELARRISDIVDLSHDIQPKLLRLFPATQDKRAILHQLMRLGSLKNGMQELDHKSQTHRDLTHFIGIIKEHQFRVSVRQDSPRNNLYHIKFSYEGSSENKLKALDALEQALMNLGISWGRFGTENLMLIDDGVTHKNQAALIETCIDIAERQPEKGLGI